MEKLKKVLENQYKIVIIIPFKADLKDNFTHIYVNKDGQNCIFYKPNFEKIYIAIENNLEIDNKTIHNIENSLTNCFIYYNHYSSDSD